MGGKYDYQYLVIGSGAAGSAAALLAAGLGARTAIVEADRWGGTTLNYRDVPYDAALGFVHRYTEALTGARMGIASSGLRFNYPMALNWQATAVRRAGGGSHKIFDEAGVDCYRGAARFVSPHEIIVGDRQISSERFLIATGTSLTVTGIKGVESVSCWTPNTALRMSRLPKVIMVVGGGSTGCEIAEYFASLGVRVLIAEAQDRLLPREDPEAGEVMAAHLKKLRAEVLTDAEVVAVAQDEKSRRVFFRHGEQEKSVRVEAIVLATAPEPNVDLGLEKAGVKCEAKGIVVGQNLRTTSSHIWAAGDVIGGESSIERATYEAKLATTNALKKSNNLVNYIGFTRMTNTLPKVAKVGLNEIDCEKVKMRHKAALVPIETTSAANTHDFREGFVKLVADLRGQVIGATVVAPEADLVAQEIALAVRSGTRVDQLAATPHVASGWSEATRAAARALV